MADERLSRRDFLKRSVGIVAGAAAMAGAWGRGPEAEAAEGGAEILNYNPAMRYRRLGKTGLMLSELSLGGHWRTREGARYWGSFPGDKVPADVQRNREDVVGRAIDLGINYLDLTTPAEATAYGAALKALGEKMWIGYSDYILCIRNPKNRTKERMMFEIDEGLRRLQMDHIAIWRPQALTGGGHTDDEMKLVVETFYEAREQGKVSHLGLSSHHRPFLMHLMQNFPEFEMLIFPLPAGAEMDADNSIFPLGKEQDVGMVTIKPFSGGSYFRAERRKRGASFDPNEAATQGLRQIISNEYLTACIPGMTTIGELENNVSIRREPRRLSAAETAAVRRRAQATMAHLPADYSWLRSWHRV